MKITIHVTSLAVVLGLVACRDDAEVGAREIDTTYDQAERDDTIPVLPPTATTPTTPPKTATQPTTPPGQLDEDEWFDIERAGGTLRSPQEQAQWQQMQQMGVEAREGLMTALTPIAQNAKNEMEEIGQELQSKLESAEGGQRERLLKIESDIEATHQEVIQNLDQLREATVQQFEQARASFFKAYERLEQQLSAARQELESSGD